MRRHSIVLFLLVALGTAEAAEPAVTHYDLRARVLIAEERLEATARLEIKNVTDRPAVTLPFLLYRLLQVSSVTDAAGLPVQFSQQVRTYEDRPTMQVTAGSITLRQPLAPGASTTILVHYSGAVLGYREVMAYVQDRIDPEYTLLRLDTLPYPVIAQPSAKSERVAYQTNFTYRTEVTVPADYTVACPDQVVSETHSGSTAVFVCRNDRANWRIDLAIAKFKIVEDRAHNFRVYAMDKDAAAAPAVLREIGRAVDFYREYFGEIPGFSGYVVIEIPEWGSQAAPGYILQTAAAFRDPTKAEELYHEIGHTWNVRSKTEVQRTRYFDEAFASYFAALALRKFDGEEAYRADLESARQLFAKWAAHDKMNADTPIAEYGEHELGRNSYTKGAWSLFVLHRLLGEDAFRKSMRALLHDFHDKPADFADFLAVVERTSGRNLKRYADDWIYGAASSKLMTDNTPIDAIVARYR